MPTPMTKVSPGYYMCEFPSSAELQDCVELNFVESVLNTKSWPSMHISVKKGPSWSFTAIVRVPVEVEPSFFLFMDPKHPSLAHLGDDPSVSPEGMNDEVPIITFLSGGQKYDSVTLVITIPEKCTLHIYEQTAHDFRSISYRHMLVKM